LIYFPKGKAKEFARKAQIQRDGDAANLVGKFFKHSFAVAITAYEIKSHTMTIPKNMKNLSVAPTAEAVNKLARQINAQATETLEDFDLIKKHFQGDNSKINRAERLFVCLLTGNKFVTKL
jgi:hypothetical protein